jgi:hypothetical protein
MKTNDNDVCPVCGERMIDFEVVGDFKKGSRVCPIGLGSCDVSLSDCNPNVDVFEDGCFVSCKCPYLKVKRKRRSRMSGHSA